MFCRELYLTFIKLLQVRTDSGVVDLPDPFKVKVKSWLKNDDQLFKEVYNQVWAAHREKMYFRLQLLYDPYTNL